MSTQELAPVRGLEGDVDGSRIVREELRLLEIVQRALATAKANQAGGPPTQDDARLLELRDEVATAKPEDLPSLFEQMHTVGALRAQRGKGAVGNVDARSPYFGHIRLVENDKRRDVLIGSRSYVDSSAGVRIVDWRHAPVSRIFYRYQEGDDYEETLGDREVEGLVTARRSVAIVQGQLVRVTAPQGTFSRKIDGVWSRVDSRVARLSSAKHAPSLEVASTRTDKHLPAIASMLDKAQFDLIARASSGLVAIQGSAGSGKTTVGLHRAAYLAFADPKRFRADRMLVVVPHEALRHFVGRVLPELGVDGVPVTTFARFAKRVAVGLFPRLPSQFSDETPSVVVRAKSHSRMLAAMVELRDELDRDLTAILAAQMAKWPDGDIVVRAWELTANLEAPDIRVSALASWFSGKRRLGDLDAQKLPDVTRGAMEKLGHELRLKSRAVVGAWDELLTSRVRLGRTFEGAKGFGSGQLDQVHDWCVRQTRVRSEGERDGELPSIDVEDYGLLLRLYQLFRGPLIDDEGIPYRYAHLFIDEVQDASPIELRVLLNLADKDRSITLAGDIAQRMLDDDDDSRGEFDWTALMNELGEVATLEPLKVSYRSTAEITRFARSVLGPLAHEAEPIASRNGPPVELFEYASSGEAVAFLADALKQLAREDPTANVALVARFAQQADVYYEGLARAEVPNVRRVAKQDFTWESGFDVTDIRQTKGLEFDEVILLETSASCFPDTPQARHALYVGATRAAHQLWCVTSEGPSKVVATAIAEQNAITPPTT